MTVDAVKTSFEAFNLDERLYRAIEQLGFKVPTLIQLKCINMALEGKDIVAKARTGSGKTLAYCIPLINKILKWNSFHGREKSCKGVILVPTRELASQVLEQIIDLLMFCKKEITCINISGEESAKAIKPLLEEKPDIIISTPARLLKHLTNQNLVLHESLQTLIIDEADLVLSFGYEGDVKEIVSFLPPICQAFLMSATLSPDVEALEKTLTLKNPAVICLEEKLDANENLKQFSINCKDADKFLLLIFMLKLKLLKGKCIFFVNNIDRCYRLKLFLEQFYIKSAILNSCLPHNSRCHIVNEFNKGIYDYLIASDESSNDSSLLPDVERKSKKNNDLRKDNEYGVSRGIDFKNVQVVLNFDFPKSKKSYTHRVGRTARGDESGTALSFVAESDQKLYHAIVKDQEGKNMKIEPYEFDLNEVESFRYRCEDALNMITKNSIKEARLKELKSEILNSEKLKQHFKENPKDLQALRHDKPLSLSATQPHMKHVPIYMIPKKHSGSKPLPVVFSSSSSKYKKGFKKTKRKNPLKTMNFSGYKK